MLRVDEGGQSTAPWRMCFCLYKTGVGDLFITNMVIVYKEGKGLERLRRSRRGDNRRCPMTKWQAHEINVELHLPVVWRREQRSHRWRRNADALLLGWLGKKPAILHVTKV